MDSSKISNEFPQFFERQTGWGTCAVHTVNNLLQEPRFTPQNFNAISNELSNIYAGVAFRSCFGYFDICVIIEALKSQNIEVEYVNKLNFDVENQQERKLSFIVNISKRKYFCYDSKHWYAILLDGNNYFKLDSNLSAPIYLGQLENLPLILQNLMNDSKVTLFSVAKN